MASKKDQDIIVKGVSVSAADLINLTKFYMGEVSTRAFQKSVSAVSKDADRLAGLLAAELIGTPLQKTNATNDLSKMVADGALFPGDLTFMRKALGFSLQLSQGGMISKGDVRGDPLNREADLLEASASGLLRRAAERPSEFSKNFHQAIAAQKQASYLRGISSSGKAEIRKSTRPSNEAVLEAAFEIAPWLRKVRKTDK